MTFGYSIRQVFDLGFSTNYTPGTKNAYTPGSEHASFVSYGGSLGVRLYRSLYFGLHDGHGIYHLVRQSRLDEIKGKWRGPSGG